MWGAGTALGELPPYFMARAARLSGQEPDDEEYAEYLEYVQGKVDQKEMVSCLFCVYSNQPYILVVLGALEIQD